MLILDLRQQEIDPIHSTALALLYKNHNICIVKYIMEYEYKDLLLFFTF